MVLHFEWELELIKWLQANNPDWMNFFYNIASLFGEQIVLIAVVATIYWCVNKRLGEYIAFSTMSSIAINSIIKNIFMAKRPFELDPEIKNLREATATGRSFPSGHTQSAATVFTSLYLAIRKNYLLWVAIIVTIIVALSRINLGVHFVTDVIVGGIVGTLIAIGMYYLFNRFEKQKYLIYLTFLLFLVPVSFIIKEKSFFVGFGLYAGYVLGIFFEQKLVSFTTEVPAWEKAVRLVLGLALLFGLRVGLKELFAVTFNITGDNNILDGFRYFLISFTGIGLYPLSFKFIDRVFHRIIE
jgi:membrane-associated phospholipid phosphatase